MAAHDDSSSHYLFPIGLSTEELAHHVENFPHETKITPSQSVQLQKAKGDVSAWLQRSADQYARIWQGHVAKNPLLESVTATNFQAKRAELKGMVPEYVWDSLEKSIDFEARKRALDSKPLNEVSSESEATHDTSHNDHLLYPLYHQQAEEKEEQESDSDEGKEESVAGEPQTVEQTAPAQAEENTKLYTDENGNPSLEKDPDFLQFQQAEEAAGTTIVSVSPSPSSADSSETTRQAEFNKETSAQESFERQQQQDFQQQEAIYNAKVREIDEDEAVDNRARKRLDGEKAELLESKDNLDRQIRALVSSGKISAEQATAMRTSGLQKIKQQEESLSQEYSKLERRATEREERKRLLRKPNSQDEENRQRISKQKQRERLQAETDRRSRLHSSDTQKTDSAQEGNIKRAKTPLERKELLKKYILLHPKKRLLLERYAKNDPVLQQALNEITEEDARKNAQQKVQQRTAKNQAVAAQQSQTVLETGIVTGVVTAAVTPTVIEHITFSTPGGTLGHAPTVSMEPPGGATPPPVSGGSGERSRRSPLGGVGNLARSASKLADMIPQVRMAKLVIRIGIPIVVSLILIIISIIMVIFGGGGGSKSSQNGQEIPVNITKTGPDQVANGAPIPYSIQVSYDGTASDIVVSDPIPTNATFVSATGNYLCDGKPPTANPTCKTVTWNASQQGASPSGTTSPSSSTKIDVTKYTKPPYDLPTPQDNASDVTYTPTIMARLNTIGSIVNQYQSYLLSQYSVADVDPFLTVIWNGAIEGIDGNQFFYNCLEGSYSLNQGCPTIASGDFQVGAGMQVGQAADHAVADFNAVYGSGKADDAAFVQQIGQAVITASNGKITYPAAFPKESLTQLLSEIASNKDSRQAFAILLMDDKFGAVSMASEVAKTINNNWAQTMCGWGSYYCDNLQKFSNRMLAIAKLYTGAGGGGSATFPPMGFTLTVKPNSSDDYVINQASAQVIP